MRIAAHRGNQLNAPENTFNALISAYTSGAQVLEFDVQLTRDNQLVVSHDGSVNRLCELTTSPVYIRDRTLKELRWTDQLDFSRSFNPSNVPGFRYYKQARRGQIEILTSVLDHLPHDIEKLIELKHDSSLTDEMREVFVNSFLTEIVNRKLETEVVVYSKDHLTLRLIRQRLPAVRVAVFNWELTADQQLDLLINEQADGLVTDLDSVLSNNQLTPFGKRIKDTFNNKKLKVGLILYPSRKPGVFTKVEFDFLRTQEFVWSLSTDTTLQANLEGEEIDLSTLCNPSYLWLDDDLKSSDVNRDWYSLGYAKANKYCFVSKNNGVHIQLDPYDGFLPKPRDPDPVKRRLDSLELGLMYVEKSWPFYSGGGLGIIRAIKGDFCATVEYNLAKPLTQAQTLEMAVTNVDPASHRATRPESFRDADAFFDPHGCPPYVGVEHDENDGYRINWNFGAAYDNNQYGPPVGEGATPVNGILRLERRGKYFSAYYQCNPQAPRWICVGVIKNESMNNSVYLRCVAKRWLQEKEDDPSSYYPVRDNTITFKNIRITKPLRQ